MDLTALLMSASASATALFKSSTREIFNCMVSSLLLILFSCSGTDVHILRILLIQGADPMQCNAKMKAPVELTTKPQLVSILRLAMRSMSLFKMVNEVFYFFNHSSLVLTRLLYSTSPYHLAVVCMCQIFAAFFARSSFRLRLLHVFS